MKRGEAGKNSDGGFATQDKRIKDPASEAEKHQAFIWNKKRKSLSGKGARFMKGGSQA